MNRQTNEFKHSLIESRKYSKNTISSYIADVNLFFKYLFENSLLMDEVDSTIIRNYVVNQLENKTSKRTVKRHLVSLNKFYDWMKKVGYVENNPFSMASSPKIEKKLPNYMDDEEICDILEQNKKRTDNLALRDQAILEILYYSGVRAQELVDLTIQNLDLSRNCAIVNGKWNKARIVSFNKECSKTLKSYLQTTRQQLLKKSKSKSAFVFLNSLGSRLTVRGLEYILKEVQEKNGISKEIHPHLFRHSFATNLLTRGAPLTTVKELLGHKSASTTAIYTHITEDTLIKNANLLPRNKK